MRKSIGMRRTLVLATIIAAVSACGGSDAPATDNPIVGIWDAILSLSDSSGSSGNQTRGNTFVFYDDGSVIMTDDCGGRPGVGAYMADGLTITIASAFVSSVDCSGDVTTTTLDVVLTVDADNMLFGSGTLRSLVETQSPSRAVLADETFTVDIIADRVGEAACDVVGLWDSTLTVTSGTDLFTDESVPLETITGIIFTLFPVGDGNYGRAQFVDPEDCDEQIFPITPSTGTYTTDGDTITIQSIFYNPQNCEGDVTWVDIDVVLTSDPDQSTATVAGPQGDTGADGATGDCDTKSGSGTIRAYGHSAGASEVEWDELFDVDVEFVKL